jgi:hypothetical protein
MTRHAAPRSANSQGRAHSPRMLTGVIDLRRNDPQLLRAAEVRSPLAGAGRRVGTHGRTTAPSRALVIRGTFAFATGG